MAKKTEEQNTVEKAETVEEQKINPEDIVFNEGEDADMPEPETAQYEKEQQYINPTAKFYVEFGACIGKLPYNSVLKNKNGSQVTVAKLFDWVKSTRNRISVEDMNIVISFIAELPLADTREIMDCVANKERQIELWTLENK